MIKEHPCLTNVWIIMCDEYSLPKDTPFPDMLSISNQDLKIAEVNAQMLTMGNIDKWLRSISFACNPTLLDVMDIMWKEIDNV